MKGFSKYQEGQEISAYTSKDEIFEGYIKTKNNIKYVVNCEGKARKLSELKLVKRVGRILEDDYQTALTDYIKKEYDIELLQKDKDNVVKPLWQAAKAGMEDTLGKVADEEGEGAVSTIIDTAAMEEKVDNGEITGADALEKCVKSEQDKEEAGEAETEKLQQQESLNIKGIAPEKLFDNRMIQKHILKEIEARAAAGAEYSQPESDYGMGADHREDAVEDCMDMITSGEPAEKIVDFLQTEYEIAKDEAENMYDDLSQDDLTWEDDFVPSEDQSDEYDLYGVMYSDIDSDVDNAFETELNSLDIDEIGFGDALVEHFANKFGGDAAKAINESKDATEAILKLAEQVKMNRVNEIRSKNR